MEITKIVISDGSSHRGKIILRQCREVLNLLMAVETLLPDFVVLLGRCDVSPVLREFRRRSEQFNIFWDQTVW